MKFRKLPVEIEAVRLLDVRTIAFDEAVPPWIDAALVKPPGTEGAIWPQPDIDKLMIGTLESPHEASIGDWIIKGTKGELYPCKPDIFVTIYEAVE